MYSIIFTKRWAWRRPAPRQFALRDWGSIPILPGFVTLSSRGPGHRPFTAVTRVRIPLGSLLDSVTNRRFHIAVSDVHAFVRSRSVYFQASLHILGYQGPSSISMDETIGLIVAPQTGRMSFLPRLPVVGVRGSYSVETLRLAPI